MKAIVLKSSTTTAIAVIHCCGAFFIMEIKLTKTFTDEKGNWWIEFKSDELKKLLEKFKPKKKKIWWKFWS